MIGAYEQHTALMGLGVEHGFGNLESEHALPDGLVTAKQVHGREVLRVPNDAIGAEADALWTTEPGVAVGVWTADCVPVLVADRRRRVVAVVHAGWRGSGQRIAEHAVQRLVDELKLDPGDLSAVIGPHIGPCCYEVDEPVRDAIRDAGVFWPTDRTGHYRLDLYELNRRQLVAAGLQSRDVGRVGSCTSCNPLQYRSYRRDGTGGRMLHYVRMPL